MPIPNTDWHSGHSSQPQRCWGLVGGGLSLLCLLGFHITASQRDGRISLRVSSQAQASRTEMPPRPPPPVGGRSSPPEKANGCAGPFYSAGNPSGQGPSPLVPPWLQRLPPELCMSELAASRHRVQLLPVVLTDLIAAGEAL